MFVSFCANVQYYFNINIYGIILVLVDVHLEKMEEVADCEFDRIIEKIIEGDATIKSDEEKYESLEDEGTFENIKESSLYEEIEMFFNEYVELYRRREHVIKIKSIYKYWSYKIWNLIYIPGWYQYSNLYFFDYRWLQPNRRRNHWYVKCKYRVGKFRFTIGKRSFWNCKWNKKFLEYMFWSGFFVVVCIWFSRWNISRKWDIVEGFFDYFVFYICFNFIFFCFGFVLGGHLSVIFALLVVLYNRR